MKKSINRAVLLLTIVFGFLATSLALAGGPVMLAPTSSPPINKAYISIGGGYSWSSMASINVDTRIWDPAPQGYDANLNSTEFYQLAYGYNITPLFTTEVDIVYRPEYKYKKFQTSTSAGTPGFLGTKTRFFNLSNLSFMFIY